MRFEDAYEEFKIYAKKRHKKQGFICGVRDESFINPHYVIRDAGSSSGLQASRLPLSRLEVGSSKGRCRQPTCYSCAGYNGDRKSVV